MIDFDRPGFLLLITPALWFAWTALRGSLAGWTKRQTLGCFFLRGAILVLVALALSGPRFRSETRDPAVVIVADVSASVGERQEPLEAIRKELRGSPHAEVLFAAEPVVSRPFGGEAGEVAKPAQDATDLGAAIEFAAALLPADRPGRVVIVSDGVSTAGRDPLEVAAALENVEIDTVPAAVPDQQEVAVAAVETPASIREGEVFDLFATVFARRPVPEAVVRLYQNNVMVSETRSSLPAGESRIVFPNVRAEGRMGIYEATIEAGGDLLAANNRKKTAVAHAGPPKVLIVDRAPPESEALAGALRAGGFSVETRPPQGLPTALEGFEAFDLVVIANAPATDFSANQMGALGEWVRRFGGGFLMLGGENSFGAGGYFRTPVGSLLPVQIEREEREETPVVALLVILDRSGSMSAPAGEQTKMALANEGAALALDVLQPRDLFGVFAVDTRVQDVVPLGPIGERRDAAKRVAGITSGGGGIYVYSALAEAFPRLRDAQAKIKHIILFSDAADAEEKAAGEENGATRGGTALDLAAAMLASRITLSVVALGTADDKDTAFLRELAGQGGGRFYLTPEATALPRIFTVETLRAAESSLREEPFLVETADPGAEAVKGIGWGEAPPLLGLNVARLKPGASPVLRSERGDTLFAEWRVGLGRAAAFLSDASGRWAPEWLAWGGYGKFWTQVARLLARPADRRDLGATLREEGGRLVLDVEAVSADGEFRDGLQVAASLAPPGLQPQSTRAAQTGPGSYRATFEVPQAENAVVAVSDGLGRPVSQAWSRDYPAEYRATADGASALRRLAEMTGGRFGVEPREIVRPAVRPAHARRELSPWLLGLAILLWPIDIWLRRREWARTGENSLPAFLRGH